MICSIRPGSADHQEPEQDGRDQGDEYVGRRPRQGHEGHPPFGIPQTHEVHRDGTGVSENEAGLEENKDSGDEYRPDRVDMGQGIEGKPARIAGGGVPELEGDVSVGDLVKDHRDHDRDDPEERLPDECENIQNDLQNDAGPRAVSSRPCHVHVHVIYRRPAGKKTGTVRGCGSRDG